MDASFQIIRKINHFAEQIILNAMYINHHKKLIDFIK